MNVNPYKLTLAKTPLVRIEGRDMSVEGALNLTVIIITYSRCRIL